MAIAQVTDLSPEEVVRRGKEIYESEIKDKVLALHRGEFLSVDVLSHDYEVGPNPVENVNLLRLRHPDAVLFELRVGYQAAYSFGGMAHEA
jgi:hypothetical protein